MPNYDDVGETIRQLQRTIQDLKADAVNLAVWGEQTGGKLSDVLPCLSDEARRAIEELLSGV